MKLLLLIRLGFVQNLQAKLRQLSSANFKSKKIKEINLPYSKDDVEFLWLAKNDNVSLIYTKVQEESFFLQIKKHKMVL